MVCLGVGGAGDLDVPVDDLHRWVPSPVPQAPRGEGVGHGGWWWNGREWEAAAEGECGMVGVVATVGRKNMEEHGRSKVWFQVQ